LPYLWFDTPNVRFLSISDFKTFVRKKNIRIVEAHYLGEKEMCISGRIYWLERHFCFNEQITGYETPAS